MHRSSFKAVISDFDGTLADSYQAITASVNHVRALHRLPPLPEPEVRKHVGRGPGHLLAYTVPGGDAENDLAAYKAHHPSVLRSGTRLFPGVAATLAALHQAGLRLAVCSNKLRPFTLELLDYFGLAALFEVVIGPEDAPVARLLVIKGDDEGKQVHLNGKVHGAGRDATSHIRLDDTEVSRRHAEFRQADGAYSVVDVGSANGTFVNGQPVKEAVLQSGDRIQIGQSILVYSAGRSEGQGASDLADRISMITRQDQDLELSS